MLFKNEGVKVRVPRRALRLREVFLYDSHTYGLTVIIPALTAVDSHGMSRRWLRL